MPRVCRTRWVMRVSGACHQDALRHLRQQQGMENDHSIALIGLPSVLSRGAHCTANQSRAAIQSLRDAYGMQTHIARACRVWKGSHGALVVIGQVCDVSMARFAYLILCR